MTDERAIDAAYAVQFAHMREAIAGAGRRLGWKIAFNDPAAQARLGLNGPLAGWLDPAHAVASGNAVPYPSGAKIRVEAEIALRLASDVPASASPEKAAAAIAAVAPAIELVDMSRPSSGVPAMAEHSFFHFATVLGAEEPIERLESPSDALKELRINGESHGPALPGRVPADLGPLLVRLAALLGHHGEALRARDIVICGSFNDPVPVAAGAAIEADFGALGVVRTTLAAPAAAGA